MLCEVAGLWNVEGESWRLTPPFILGLRHVVFPASFIDAFCTGVEKDAGGDIVEIRDEVPEIWLLQGSRTVYFQKPDLAMLPKGDLTKASAHWCAVFIALLHLFGSLYGDCSADPISLAVQGSLDCAEIHSRTGQWGKKEMRKGGTSCIAGLNQGSSCGGCQHRPHLAASAASSCTPAPRPSSS